METRRDGGVKVCLHAKGRGRSLCLLTLSFISKLGSKVTGHRNTDKGMIMRERGQGNRLKVTEAPYVYSIL